MAAIGREPATKGDVRETELRLDAKIETAVRHLKTRFGSIMAVAVGVILAAIRYLPAGHPRADLAASSRSAKICRMSPRLSKLKTSVSRAASPIRSHARA